MASIGNLKLGQWRRLFIKFNSSLMQSLTIFQTREGFYFEFQRLEEFEIYLKKGKRGRAHWSVALAFLAHVRRAPSAWSWPLPFHHCHQTATTGRHPTWAQPYPRVGDAVDKFSPFTSRLASPLLHRSHAHHSIHRCRSPPLLLVTIQAKDLVRHVPLFK
jgi:hypothetical protein